MTKDQFIAACRHATAVETPRGLALLIAGKVIEVNAPPSMPQYEDPILYAHWLAEALSGNNADD